MPCSLTIISKPKFVFLQLDWARDAQRHSVELGWKPHHVGVERVECSGPGNGLVDTESSEPNEKQQRILAQRESQSQGKDKAERSPVQRNHFDILMVLHAHLPRVLQGEWHLSRCRSPMTLTGLASISDTFTPKFILFVILMDNRDVECYSAFICARVLLLATRPMPRWQQNPASAIDMRVLAEITRP